MPVNLQLERSFDPEHHDIVDLVTQFVERRSDPGGPPVLDRPTLAELAELALIGTGLPVQHGGAGIDDIRIAAAIRVGSCRAGASGLGIALTECAHVALTVLDSVADGPARDRWYADIVAGRVLVALVVAGDGVTATPSDRGWTLSGRATAGVGVAGADLLVVVADAAHGPLTFLMTPAGHGVRVDAELPVLGPAGLRAAAVEFSDAPAVPTGTSERTADALHRAAVDQELLTAAGAVAESALALDWTAAYTATRTAFGAPIAAFQNTRLMLGDVAAQVAAADSLVASTLADRIAGVCDGRASAAAKLRATAALAQAVDAGLQLHGGYGYMVEYPISRAFVAARVARLIGIRSESQLLEAAARRDAAISSGAR